jgi:hypothetical protein
MSEPIKTETARASGGTFTIVTVDNVRLGLFL